MDITPFIVSARKYRPQNFDIVVGQNHITTTLKNAILNQHVAHAYLFCGPRGVGKTTCARILAKAVNCENLSGNAEPCNQCGPCSSFQTGSTFHVFELDAASNNSVEDIRHLIEQVRYAPQGGIYKVFIVDEVHMLSTGAFNAFLKTLEEPPPFAIFILATTEKSKILPTILSRCQIFEFKRIGNQDIEDYLQNIANKEGITTEPEALKIIAQKSEGGMRDALSLFDKIASFTNNAITYKNTIEHLNVLDQQFFFEMMGAMAKQDIAKVLVLFDDIYKRGFDGDTFLDLCATFLRDLLVCKTPGCIQLLDILEMFKPQYNTWATNLNLSFLLSSLNIINEASIQFKNTRNKKLLVESALIKMTFLSHAIEVLDGEKSLDIKKKIAYNNILQQRPILYQGKFGENVSSVAYKVEPAKSIVSEVDIMPTAKPNIDINKPIYQAKKIESQADILKRINLKKQLNTDDQTILTQLLLNKLLIDYVQVLENNKNAFSANIFKISSFKLIAETNNISVSVAKIIDLEALQKNEYDFTQFVFQKTKISNIKLDINIEKIVETVSDKQQFYTSSELFDKLGTINPALKKLKDALNMDVII